MSRRKLRPPELPGPEYFRNQSVRVICTDRGQHDPVLLFHLTDRQVFTGLADLGRPHARNKPLGWSREVMWPEGSQGRRRDTPVAGWAPGDGGRTFRFDCPACPRDVRLREELLFRALDAVSGQRHGDEHPKLDISMLG